MNRTPGDLYNKLIEVRDSSYTIDESDLYANFRDENGIHSIKKDSDDDIIEKSFSNQIYSISNEDIYSVLRKRNFYDDISIINKARKTIMNYCHYNKKVSDITTHYQGNIYMNVRDVVLEEGTITIGPIQNIQKELNLCVGGRKEELAAGFVLVPGEIIKMYASPVRVGDKGKVNLTLRESYQEEINLIFDYINNIKIAPAPF